MTIFQGMGCRMTKMNITFSMRNGVPNTALKFFPEKSPYRRNESQKPVSRAHISGSIGLFPKKYRVHPCVDSHQPCKFHENWFRTATCIVHFFYT